jgi:hypothetical protein
VVPFSGGKDSIYVAYKMKEFGMTPQLVTVLPHLETEIGEWNRKNLCPEFERFEIKLSEDKYRDLAKRYFIEDGRPKHPWETAISAAIIDWANKFGPKLIMYGEEGEQEYGGASREADRWALPVDKEYLMKYYYQNHLDWEMPSDEDFGKMFFTQWSRFENWNPTKHIEFAIDKGMGVRDKRSVGTFTFSCQLSDKLQDLHAYLMFVKFGFGRCTSDVNIAIRDGLFDRMTGLEHIENYDGEFPNEYLQEYLDYFDMTHDEFTETINKFGNRELMDNMGYVWNLKEWVFKHRRRDMPQELVSPHRGTFQRRTHTMK